LSNSESHHYTRRGFLGKLALGIGGITLAGGAYAAVRSLVPNVLYEPSKFVKVGLPQFIQDGVTLVKEAKAYVFKKTVEGKTKFYCMSAVCTHLGCIVQYVGQEETPAAAHANKPKVGFSCPCHGSQFTIDGDVIAGPAPKSLPWLALSVSPDDGQLVIDTAAQVDREKSLLVWDASEQNIRKV
jgi:cytochrome b6-f complex iron-sulfur subunit